MAVVKFWYRSGIEAAACRCGLSFRQSYGAAVLLALLSLAGSASAIAAEVTPGNAAATDSGIAVETDPGIATEIDPGSAADVDPGSHPESDPGATSYGEFGRAATFDAGGVDSTASDADQLAARLAGLNDFAASFDQAIAGTRGQILEQSTGYVLLSRPNFKWVVDAPYPQVIVTEGDRLKVYDPDLEQLTIRPLAEALSDTPISLLTRDEIDLDASFLVVALPGQPGDEPETQSFIVSPRGADSLFAEIELRFTAAGLASLGIVDHLGQYTEIRFRAEPDRVIQSSDFQLTVPPETDVIGG